MSRRFACLIVCALAQLGCASVDSYREAMPAHPGLADVLGAPADTLAFSGDAQLPDAEAHLVRPGRRGAGPVPPPPHHPTGFPPLRGPMGLQPKPVLNVPASLAVVELAAYSERGDLPWSGAAVWEPTPWTAQLQSPSFDTIRVLRNTLVASPTRPDGGWPAIGGPNLDPFAQAVAIPSFLLPNHPSLAGVRRAAGGVGSEVVLVLGRRTRILEGHNACALLYPLLVGLLLPAEETRVWTRYEAALIDVRSGGVLAVAQGESEASWSSVPLAGGLAEHADDVRECEQAALVHVLDELRLALAHLEGQGRFRPRGQGAAR